MPTEPRSGIVVLHCPAGGGHRAAATAIAEAARARGRSARVIDALELTPSWFARAYVGAHLESTARAPELYGRAYAAMNRRRLVLDGVRSTLEQIVGAELWRHVIEARPEAVVATHFFPLSVLGSARRAGDLGAPLIGVVTDYAAHALWAEPGVDAFCAPAGRAAADLVGHGVAARAIATTGIPVRPAFGELARLGEPAPDEPTRVLVTCGGFGIGPMAEVVRSFRGIPRVELTVVCGAAGPLAGRIERLAAEAGVRATVVGFERDMPRRMGEAHLVVGKPGGLTVSETLAAGRPMIVVGACPGQETRNQEWVVLGGAGLVSEPEQVGAKVGRLRQAGALTRLSERAREMGRPAAASRVVDVVLDAVRRHARMVGAAAQAA